MSTPAVGGTYRFEPKGSSLGPGLVTIMRELDGTMYEVMYLDITGLLAHAFGDELTEVVQGETQHPQSGEPHQFHVNEPCFPGCPAWDSKR